MDNHIWFSVMKRPPNNPFTRVQRCTCCFVLIYCSMMASLMFFGQAAEDEIEFHIGPITIGSSQISIGVQTGLVIAPVNLLIVFIFRSVKPKPKTACGCCSRPSDRTSDPALTDDASTSGQGILPWWFVYVGYFISLVVCGVAFFFANHFAKELGYRKCTAWIRAFSIAIFQSAFVQDPAQVG